MQKIPYLKINGNNLFFKLLQDLFKRHYIQNTFSITPCKKQVILVHQVYTTSKAIPFLQSFITCNLFSSHALHSTPFWYCYSAICSGQLTVANELTNLDVFGTILEEMYMVTACVVLEDSIEPDLLNRSHGLTNCITAAHLITQCKQKQTFVWICLCLNDLNA